MFEIEEIKHIQRSVEWSSEGYTIRSRIVIPGFSKAELQQSGKKLLSGVLFGKMFFKIKVFIYPSGCSPENNGYVSVLFTSTRIDEAYADDGDVYYLSTAFTCIVSLVDSLGEERFTQSGFKECENDVEPPFGFKQFVKCEKLLNNHDEFISNDELTISCYCFYKNNGHVSHGIRVPNFQNNVDDCCPSATKCYRYKINDCCQSLIKELTPEKTVLKLVFKGPLFEFLKRESRYFQRIQEVEMQERKANSMNISWSEKKIFDWIQGVVYSAGLFTVFGSSMEEFYELYEFADKYEIFCILNTCSDYLKKKLTASNAVKILTLADLHNDPDLKTTAIHFIRSCWSEVKSTEEWDILKETRNDLMEEVFHDSFQGFS